MKIKRIDGIVFGLCLLLLGIGLLFGNRLDERFSGEQTARITADSLHTANIQELRQEMLDSIATIRDQ